MPKQIVSSEALGIVCLILWCLISAYSRVYASHLLQSLSPFLLCFYIFLIATLFFILLNMMHLHTLAKKVWQHRRDVVYFNLSSFACWFFVIYPLKYIEPSLVTALDLSLAPIFTLLMLPLLYKEPAAKKSSRYICYGFFVAFIYMVGIIFLNLSSFKVSSYFYTVVSVICIAIAALALSLNNLYAKRLADNGFQSIENIAIRFFALIALSAIIAKMNHIDLRVDKATFQSLLSISLLYAIIPLYLIQISIRALKPFALMSIVPLMALTTFAFENFSHRFQCSLWTLVALVTTFVLSCISIWFHYQHKVQ